ncbi:helix-turn-helix transcriptional regulator [Sphingomonas quercus]|uniref:Helix-turn-helix domain-containing protein n=1 Tax=Sphingomonas quercus TaxID=2842451 RepID=A0ABS6BKP1_9SPHN|nr:AlpA family phage regulatory protein [Sphingomonas quercus]MBU3078860.1 helix-turn-helix domain-containing protein [Sphingomonas quercus]
MTPHEKPQHPAEPEAITVRIPTALRMLGLSRSQFYLMMKDGEIETIKVGRATLVVVASLHRFVAARRR